MRDKKVDDFEAIVSCCNGEVRRSHVVRQASCMLQHQVREAQWQMPASSQLGPDELDSKLLIPPMRIVTTTSTDNSNYDPRIWPRNKTTSITTNKLIAPPSHIEQNYVFVVSDLRC